MLSEINDGDKENKVHDFLNKKMNLGLLKPTDLKNNQRIFMPDPLPTKIENQLTAICTVAEECLDVVIKENEKNGVKNENSGLKMKHINGLSDLKKVDGVKPISTDKSRKHGIISTASYKKAIEKNVQSCDVEITREELREIERNMNGLAMSTLRCFNVGLDLENPKGSERIASAVTSTNRDASSTDAVFKDHKPVGEDGLLKTRPLSNCINSTTEQTGDLLAIPIGIVQTRDDEMTYMIKSTEEHLAGNREFNRKQSASMNDKEKRVLGGMDVVGLYINIQPERAAEELSDEVLEGGYEISHNADECAKFIAVNLDRNEICKQGLSDVIPCRKSFKGGDSGKPTMLGEEMNMRPAMLLSESVREKFKIGKKKKKKSKFQ